jgi:hypothetical protein
MIADFFFIAEIAQIIKMKNKQRKTNIAPSEQSQNPIAFNFLYATLIDV